MCCFSDLDALALLKDAFILTNLLTTCFSDLDAFFQNFYHACVIHILHVRILYC